MAADDCLSYNCTSIGNHTPNDCGTEILSGYSELILLECGHGITNFESAAQYTAALNAGTAIMVQEVKMGFDLPSAISVTPNVSGETETTVNYNRTATVKDGNVSGANDDWYSSANVGRRFAGFIAYSNSDPDNPRIRVVLGKVKMNGGLVALDDDTDTERYEHTLAWKSKTGPRMYTAPVGIFS